MDEIIIKLEVDKKLYKPEYDELLKDEYLIELVGCPWDAWDVLES
jgi:hypothetical protein